MPCCFWDSAGLVRFLRVARPNWLPCTITVLFNCSTSEMKFRSIRNFFKVLTSVGLVSMLGFCETTESSSCVLSMYVC